MQQLKKAFYQATIQEFLASSEESILGILAQNNHYELTQEQRNAWEIEVSLLQKNLTGFSGYIFLEHAIPAWANGLTQYFLWEMAFLSLSLKLEVAHLNNMPLSKLWTMLST